MQLVTDSCGCCRLIDALQSDWNIAIHEADDSVAEPDIPVQMPIADLDGTLNADDEKAGAMLEKVFAQ